MKTEKIVLIDSNSLINRAFYALPQLTNSKGIVTNAIYGYLSMLIKLIEDEDPTHICAIFDVKGPTFRNDIYPEYKGTRKPMPEELSVQFPLLKELLSSLGIYVLEKKGYEADDLIGTLAKRYNEEVIIVSGDRDVLQLVDSSTRVYITKKGVSDVIIYDLEKLKEENFTPNKIIEYKALAGDHSDNIPGAPGVGDKTAVKLLEQFSSVEEIIEKSGNIPGKLGDNIKKNKDLILLSKRLATIDTNVPVNLTLSQIIFNKKAKDDFFSLLNFLEIKTLVSRFSTILGLNGEQDNNVATPKKENAFGVNEKTQGIIEDKINIKNKFDPLLFLNKRGPIQLSKDILFKEINDLIQLKDILDNNKSKIISIYFSDLISFAFDEKIVYIIKCKEDLIDNFLPFEEALLCFRDILASNSIVKILFDVKGQKHKLKRLNLSINFPYEDLMLKEYLLRSHISYKSEKDYLAQNNIEKEYLAPSLYLKINLIQDGELEVLDLVNLYKEMELPLIEILFDMEIAGFNVDQKVLLELSIRFNKELEELTTEIFKIAGTEFNINSPKQLAEVLFDVMKLKPLGKNKKGGYSVDVDVLESIDHPIATYLLRYRKMKKLQSTYIDGMKNFIDVKTGKIHTIFQQCVTTTGRLSSTDPNMQNIPVRNEEGREIRKMLIPSQGNILVTADYSQIELRLLAHFSKDEALINSYNNNEDIHASTASKIFGIKIGEVDSNMRRAAKAINFGIIYGISPYGLSKNIGSTVKEAKDFVDKYFQVHPSVKLFMHQNEKYASDNYYIRSFSNRIRFFPEFSSGNIYDKNFASRAAMNMPLQGSSSDIIKIAMLNVYNCLKKANYKAKLILQVHDELILDVPKDEEVSVRNILVDCMENAVNLSVPLIVDTKTGLDWFQAS